MTMGTVRIVLMMSLILGLATAVEQKSAEASWRSSHFYGNPAHQGYCKNARQTADVRRCRENRTDNPAQRKKPNN